MIKWVVLACLCGLAFAKTMYNADLGCSYHVKIEDPDEPFGYASYETFVVSYYRSSRVPRYNKILYSNGDKEYMRCDIRNSDNDCYVQFDYAGYCEEDFRSPEDWTVLFRYQSSFEYFEFDDPVDVKCPDNSTGCKMYETQSGLYITVNQEGYFVNVSGVIWTFYDPPSMDEFVIESCDSSDPNPLYPAPVDMCGSMKTYIPPQTQMDCPFHLGIQGDDGESYDYYGAEVNGLPAYAKLISSSYNVSIRCDTIEEKGACYIKYDFDMCNEEYRKYDSIWEYFLSFPEMFEYDSVNYPKVVVCPDDSAGCKLYCDDILEANCITVNDAGRIVKIGNKSLTYLEPPSIDVFDVVTCDGQQLPAPLDFCAEKEVVSPKLPDCAFHIKTERGIPTTSYDVYGLKVNGQLSMIRINGSNFVSIVRFDVIKENNVFVQAISSDDCQDHYVSPVEVMSEMSLAFLPQSFRYNSNKYPVDVECPDGTQGCKKYCSLFSPYEQECAIVDANGYFVQTKVLGIMTYDSEVPLDVFEIDTCNNQTHIPAPPADICPSPSSTTSKTSIDPSLSSASSAKAALIVVAVAVAAFIL